jgi:hypothetical protein
MKYIIQLANNSLITRYYEQQDTIFWNNLAKNSTAYLSNNIPFPKEGKNIFFTNLIVIIILFSNNENIWELSDSIILTMYNPGDNYEFKRPANIQINLEQKYN